MRDVIHHIDPCDLLLLQEVDGLTFLFAENCHKHIRAGDLLATRRLHVKHGALEHSLKAKRRLCLALAVARGNQRGRRFDEFLQILS